MAESEAINMTEYRKAVAQASRRKQELREMTEKFAALQQEVEQLRGQVTELSETNEQLQASVAEYEETFNDEFFDNLEALQGEYETLKENADKYTTDPSVLQKHIQELESKLVERDHFAEFDKVASELIHPDALADARVLAGYKPEGGTPDPAKIREMLTSLVTSKPYLRKPEDSGGKTAADAAGVTDPAKDGSTLSGARSGQASDGSQAPGGARSPSLQVAPSLAGPGVARGVPETAPPLFTVAARVANEFQASGRSDPFRL